MSRAFRDRGWTEIDDAELRRLVTTMSVPAIARFVGRTQARVQDRIVLLGLSERQEAWADRYSLPSIRS